jgi:pyruvate ferredoxin oxidoreductase delta subunit
MSNENVKPGWKSIPLGGVCWKSSEDYFTGDWRSEKPILDDEKCTQCLFCWIYCPDIAILWDGKAVTIDYNFCKGCGICAKECPFEAIKMVKE